MSSTLDKIQVRSKYNKAQQEVLEYLQSRLVDKNGKRVRIEDVQKAATLRYAGMLMAQEKELRDNAQSTNTVAGPSGDEAVPSPAPEPASGQDSGSGT